MLAKVPGGTVSLSLPATTMRTGLPKRTQTSCDPRVRRTSQPAARNALRTSRYFFGIERTSAVSQHLAPFTPFHRGGSGPPLVLLHGFLSAWRTWELVLPALERRHEVLALTLPGHAGGPAISGDVDGDVMADAVEAAMDAAGFALADVAGNSLGGYVALQLAARGRARSVVALAPAGGWARDDESWRDLLAFQADLRAALRTSAVQADALLATPEGRRRAATYLAERTEHIPAELLAHEMLAAAACRDAPRLIQHGLQNGFPLDAAAIACPVRIVWGTADKLLPWPAAATRYRRDWLPHADWVELGGVGHAPQLDVPLETAQLILGWTAP